VFKIHVTLQCLLAEYNISELLIYSNGLPTLRGNTPRMYSLNTDNIKGTVMENYFITLNYLASYRQLSCVYVELKPTQISYVIVIHKLW
jgi:hypothetical protein